MYLFFDTETTGLPKNWTAPVTDLKNWPRMVQIAWLVYDEAGNLQAEADYIIKPQGYTIPAETARIHGITTEKAAAEGHDLATVLSLFQSAVQETKYLVAHNIAFDVKIVGAEFLRNGMSNTLPAKSQLCTMEGSKEFCAIPGNYGYKWPRLSELHKKLFHSSFSEAHNAKVDIAITAKCFWELRKKGVL